MKSCNKDYELPIELRRFIDEDCKIEYTSKQVLQGICHILSDPSIDPGNNHADVQLVTNSMNASVGIYSNLTGSRRLVKVQTSLKRDNLCNDVLVCQQLNNYKNKKTTSHVPRLLAFMPIIIENTWNERVIRFRKYSSTIGYAKQWAHAVEVHPCMITDVVGSSVSIMDVFSLSKVMFYIDIILKKGGIGIRNLYDYIFKNTLRFAFKHGHVLDTLLDLKYEFDMDGLIKVFRNLFMPMLDHMCNYIIKISKHSMFVHNDMHPGNILLDTTNMSFTLIDFGRSYIDLSLKDIVTVANALLPVRIEGTSVKPFGTVVENVERSSDPNDTYWGMSPSDFRIRTMGFVCPAMMDVAALAFNIYIKMSRHSHVFQKEIEALGTLFRIQDVDPCIRIPSTIASIRESVRDISHVPTFMVKGLAWLATYLRCHMIASKDTYGTHVKSWDDHYALIKATVVFKRDPDKKNEQENRRLAILFETGVFFKQPFARVEQQFALDVAKLDLDSIRNNKRSMESKGGGNKKTKDTKETQEAEAAEEAETQDTMAKRYADILQESEGMKIRHEDLPIGWK